MECTESVEANLGEVCSELKISLYLRILLLTDETFASSGYALYFHRIKFLSMKILLNTTTWYEISWIWI